MEYRFRRWLRRGATDHAWINKAAEIVEYRFGRFFRRGATAHARVNKVGKPVIDAFASVLRRAQRQDYNSAECTQMSGTPSSDDTVLEEQLNLAGGVLRE